MLDLPFTFKPEALKQVKLIIQNKGIPESYGLRVGVKGGSGCGGHQFILGFDNRKEDDKVFELEGIKVYVLKAHMMYVSGVEIDYEQTDEGLGFTFSR